MRIRNCIVIGAGLTVAAILCACRGETIPQATYQYAQSSNEAMAPNANCTPSSHDNVTVCVRIPAHSGYTKVVVSDSIYGEAPVGKPERFNPSTCQENGGARTCVAAFEGPVAVNQIEVDGYKGGSLAASATFPLAISGKGQSGAASASASLGGSIDSVNVYPFHDSGASVGQAEQRSFLPLGQSEGVWIVAQDSHGSVIVGNFQPKVSVATTGHLTSSATTLTSSLAAESLTAAWSQGFAGNSAATLTASAGGRRRSTADVDSSSGVIYYTPGPNDSSAGAGAVATAPDGSVYFAINDESGCTKPGKCHTEIGHFTPPDSISTTPLPIVPGVRQLYVTTDGALWMAPFQPRGTWNFKLPVLRLPPGSFSGGMVQPLPLSFGEPSGFLEDGSDNLWISGCTGSHCSQDHNGTPVVVETTVAGSYTAPQATVDLPLSCANFGYLGYSVGDIGLLGGKLYVLGLNDGSAPPASGTIWQVSTSPSLSATCSPPVPKSFNPSPFFALANGSLVFGIGGNPFNVRWGLSHGFYALTPSGSGSATLETQLDPLGTATHVSAFGKLVYYIANGERNIKVYGLATYLPPTQWNVFPSASFSGTQFDSGVAADKKGAWFTANGICGSWKGVCLGRAVYVSKANWGSIPKLGLPALHVGDSTTFGVVTNPTGLDAGAMPLNGHSGPFFARPSQPKVCSIDPITKPYMTFVVHGLHEGACAITITDSDHPDRLEPLVTQVTK